ncbi:RNA polymerase II elongation factor ELL like protein [Argiope bruennichi]|uniref:RNA polymerase II elongation factor ELL like protein n=1 Tax=Argiope bruennichi TaxID=94029 RepID=A0A8T0FFZ6_ARGBR|nr:RNA polymerase II elongation factor ELL like protein [Argiope bruennichi]
MDSLVEGKTYSLSIDEKNMGNKSYIYVKLTDSMVKSIEEHTKQAGGSNPKIQFNEYDGMITFPSDKGTQKYAFSLSDTGGKENEDWNNLPNRSFECVQQNKNGSLESLGGLMMKMQIRAKEDSYENTKSKVAAAEKEQKQYCTKEIKPSIYHLGHQLIVNQQKSFATFLNSCSLPTAKSLAPVRSKNNIGNMLTTVSSARHDSNPLVRPMSISSARRNSNPSVWPMPISSARRNSNPFGKSASILPGSPESITFQHQRKENSKSKVPSGIQRQPLRDRIIHLLALRPYKKPEILLKLRTEGVNEKDKNNLTGILAQVSTMKKNSYYLSDGLWNEVQENWKFYSPDDAEIVRKNKQQHVLKKIHLDNQPSTFPKKRLPNDNSANIYPSLKKQRISRLNGQSKSLYSRESNQHGNPENAFKGMNFLNTKASLMQETEKHSSFIESHNKDYKNTNFNQVSQATKLFSPEYRKKNIDLNSPTTQSSGYVSKDSSRSSKEPSSDELNFEGVIYDQKLKRESDSKMARTEDSNLSFLVPSSCLKNDKQNSLQKTPASSYKQERNNKKFYENNPISSNNREYEMKADNLNSSTLCSNLNGDSNCDPFKSSNLECEKKEGLKLVFKIKSDKSIKPPKESFQYKLKNNSQISSAHSSRLLKKSYDAVKTSTVKSSLKYDHLKSSPITESPLLSSIQDAVCHQTSDATKYASEETETLSDNSEKELEWNANYFERHYVKIVSEKQRLRYITVYNDDVHAYNELWKQISAVRNNFVALQKQLEECEKGSAEYQRLEKKIQEEYEAANNFEYKNKRKESFYLYGKLCHIKKLLDQYDLEQRKSK